MVAANGCPVCKNDQATVTQREDRDHVRCPRCGDYTLTATATAVLLRKEENPRQIANASGWLREHPKVFLGSKDIQALLDVPTPSVAERAEKLLSELGRREKFPGAPMIIHFERKSDVDDWLGVAWAATEAELKYYVGEYLAGDRKLVVALGLDSDSGISKVTVTPSGYMHLESLRRGNVDSQIGFCAMWFDPSVKVLWTDAIEPAIRDAQYHPLRIDKHEHNNRIDDEMIAKVRAARFVVADATEHRQNVYWEAGFASGLGRPVIWTCREDHLANAHFDTRQYSHLSWRPDQLSDFKTRLQSRILATLGQGSYRPVE